MRSVYRGVEYDDEFMIIFARFGMLTSAGVICCDFRCGLRFAGDLLVATSQPAVRRKSCQWNRPRHGFTARLVYWM